ncbi:MAG: fructokinase [Paracoccaceae bacterium]
MIIEVPPKTDPFFVKMKEGALPATDGHEALKAVGIKHGILTMPDDGGPGLRKVADGIIGTTPMQNGVDGRRMCVWCVVCVWPTSRSKAFPQSHSPLRHAQCGDQAQGPSHVQALSHHDRGHGAPRPQAHGDHLMFVVCGEALWDLFAEQTSDDLIFRARIGGSPFNVAVGLARLGVDAALMTGLSTDRLGARLDAVLAHEGVSRDLLQRVPDRTTLSLVDIAGDGGPSYVFYGDGAADRAVVAVPEFGAPVWGVHMGSFSLMVQPVGDALLAMAAREAGRRLVTLDPNVRLNVVPDTGIWRARITAFAAHADLIKVSAEDLGLLWPGADPADIAQRWRSGGAALVIITHGGDGAEAFGAFGHVRVPGRRVQVVDTVGAGDSFMAALIAGLAARGARTRAALVALTDAEALLAEAARAAAITCGRRGADLPRKADLAQV